MGTGVQTKPNSGVKTLRKPVFSVERGCRDCPVQATCTSECPPLKEYLGRTCRAFHSPKTKNFTDVCPSGSFEDIEPYVLETWS